MRSNHRSLQVGVVGCGYIFHNIYASILNGLSSRLEVAALCDIRQEAAFDASRKFPKARIYGSAAQLFDNENLDAVLVLTKEMYNAPTAALALDRNMAIFLEKPPSISLAEWENLRKKERNSKGHIYAAFNRRHTPFTSSWKVPPGLRRVRGTMTRLHRTIKEFPFTTVHLIDSAQYFSGSIFASAVPIWDKTARCWQVSGVLENGVECELTMAPDSHQHSEYLSFEANEKWEIHFPNPEADQHPDGYLARDGSLSKSLDSLDPVEAMGYSSSLRDFLDLIESGAWSESRHKLDSCGPTIGMLEEMLRQVEVPS